MDSIDESVNPCHDFYQFSCGKWIDNKKQYSSINQFLEVGDKITIQLDERQLFIRNIKYFYNSCFNTTQLKKLGRKPLDNLIAKLGGWPVVSGDNWTDIQWTDVYLRLRDVGVYTDMLFSLWVKIDQKNNSKRILTINSPTFGLESRDKLLLGNNDKSIKAYKTLIRKTLGKLGVKHQMVELYVEKLFTFELQLANNSMPKEAKRNHTLTYNKITIKQLIQLAPNAQKMFNNIVNEFRSSLQLNKWMKTETLEKALKKLDNLKLVVGYPDQLMDEANVADYYHTLTINNSDDYFGNHNLLNKWFMDLNFGGLKKSIDPLDWRKIGSLVDVNANYQPQRNRVFILASILQEVFYNKDRPNYMNYGAIGFVFGHELIHGFDDEGRQYDSTGNLRNWWDTDTDALYKQKAECFVQQYSNFTVNEISKKVNGLYTQGENIADNGGIIQSYRAYEKYVAKRGPEPRLPALNYTSEQLFWISSAVQWCSKLTNEQLLNKLLTDVHTPYRQRVNGYVSNSVDFSKVFNCSLGSPMNPLNKCKLW
ncbi:neprilysin-2-like [Oppia nitens]|uniref:neprilysin-2-like n=1 Tax=Oppia nitens TaxID=1686743 RepID=UPI0023DC8F06|nr:neprilysin-2-like [Oppia nitens]